MYCIRYLPGSFKWESRSVRASHGIRVIQRGVKRGFLVLKSASRGILEDFRAFYGILGACDV